MLGSRFLWKLYAGYVVIIVVTAGLLAGLVTRNVENDLEKSIRQDLIANAHILHDVALPALKAGPGPTFQERIHALGEKTGRLDDEFTGGGGGNGGGFGRGSWVWKGSWFWFFLAAGSDYQTQQA